MSYFSSNSNWLSMVDAGRPACDPGFPKLDESRVSGSDGFALPAPDFTAVPAARDPGTGAHGSAGGDCADAAEGSATGEGGAREGADLDHLRTTIELRRKLFFHLREWEFGPALLEDHLRMARAQADAEAALAEYCFARHVSVTLVGKLGREEHRLAWIEIDRVIAEIHALIGNNDSARVYAREGLQAIKNGRFGSEFDMRITRLAVRFLNLLEGR